MTVEAILFLFNEVHFSHTHKIIRGASESVDKIMSFVSGEKFNWQSSNLLSLRSIFFGGGYLSFRKTEDLVFKWEENEVLFVKCEEMKNG